MNQEKKFPNALVIVFSIMIFAALLTWILPAGRYEMVQGTKTLDPNSFHYIEKSPVSLWSFLTAVFRGMNKASSIIVFTFMCGGMFNVLIESKSVDAFINLLIRRLGNKVNIVIPVLVLIMSLLGATGVMANPVVSVIPIGIILSRKLKMDQIVAVAVTFLAAYSGYATSPICAMTVQVAQRIAEIPLLSGFGFRCIIYIVFLIPTEIYIMKYSLKVKNDNSKSIMGKDIALMNEDVEDLEIPFTLSDALSLLSLVSTLGIYTYCSLKYKWGMGEMATMMMIMAFLVAIFKRMGTEGLVNGFLKGARQMAFSAMLIGLASGVSVILSDGNILHTIIHSMAVALSFMPRFLFGPIMYLFNLFFNFFVNSGSGQATVVMPIMAPLADVINMTRQAAVTAFQLGDGLSNVIFPTSGTLMASIAIAGVDFKKWLEFVLPLFALWAVMGFVVIMLVVASGVA
ncbi:MAG: YfcC family protein [Spirochaetales bacterium]|nr:YfcC family protein [Spirochaetales bacterium]